MARGYPDFEGDKSGLYLKPEWAAFEAKDKSFFASAVDQPFDGSASASYTVPTGKRLLITLVSARSYASAAADADNNQMCEIGGTDDGTTILQGGGNGGATVVLNKPIVFEAGHLAKFDEYNKANHDTDLGMIVLGYEVDV